MSLLYQKLLIMMRHNHYSSDQAAKVLRLITDCGPILAADLAIKIGLQGCRESNRRKIRAIVHYLKNENGNKIVSNFIDGYWIAADDKEWQASLDSLQIGAKKTLAVTHKKLKMVTDGRGQGLLFVPCVGKLDNNQFQIRSA